MRSIVRDRILKKYNNRCAHCGGKDHLEVDHIIPLSKGGRHDEDNFQILCKTCNLKKGSRFEYKKFVKIGVNPEYILLDTKFSDQIWSLTSREFKYFIEEMFKANDQIENYSCK